MAYNFHTEEDYIDIEMIPSSNILCNYTITSPPHQNREEFEFQMCSSLLSNNNTTPHNQITTTLSPADELFYKGKLLPLHLPPRLQMVQSLLHDPPINNNSSTATTTSTTTSTSTIMTTANASDVITPFYSRDVSPSLASRRASNDGDEYFFEWSTEFTSFINTSHVKKPLTRKKIKRSYLSQKLKASRTYLMSLFTKSSGNNESCAKAAAAAAAATVGEGDNVEYEAASKGKDCLMNYMKVKRKNQSCGNYEYNNENASNSLIRSIEREIVNEDCFNSQRRSFSGAIQLHSIFSSGSGSGSGSSSSSSSFSFSSNGTCDLQMLKRSSSASSEIESSIQGAIAHCKKSQQQAFNQRKMVSEGGVCPLSSGLEVNSGSCESEVTKA